MESTDDQPLSHQPTPARPDIRGQADKDLSQYGRDDGPGTPHLTSSDEGQPIDDEGMYQKARKAY